MCTVFAVSRSGYYSYRKGTQSQRARDNAVLAERIGTIFEKRKERYGSPRITQDLRDEGHRCGKNRVARIMREKGHVAKARRRYKATTRKDARHAPYAPDRLKRQFTAEAPNRVWSSDLTYIWTSEGWLYLVVLLDLCTREIIGWADGARMNAQLVCTALRMALLRRKPEGTMILHSDRGAQYTSGELTAMLQQPRATILASHAYSCYDNAVTESFFNTIKTELTSWERYQTRRDAHQSIFEYIEIFYNRQRRHSTLNGRTPAAVFESFTHP
jgi:putative transposase